MIALADCNNFFVSCERAVNPWLEGKAVVVMSNNDGCIVARSNEAKRLGIKMGQPLFEVRELVDSGKVIAISGHHLLYKRISIKVHTILRRYALSAIDYSVDEAFLDMEGVPQEALMEIGEHMVSTVWQQVHIPITVGFALTKTLAKIATERGKKSGRSVVMLADEPQTHEALKLTPIADLWGVGRRLTRRMYIDGIHTAYDLSQRDRHLIRSKYGVNGERTWLELRGTPCIELSHIGRPLQDSISESRTFPMDIDDYDYLRARVAMYADHCGRRLRTMKGECRRLVVSLSTNRFHTENGYQSPAAAVEFATGIDDAQTLVGAAIAAFDRIYDPRMKYKRAGVELTHIRPAGIADGDLFDTESGESREHRARRRKVSEVADRLNRGDGRAILPLATELTKGHPGHNDGYSSTFQFRS